MPTFVGAPAALFQDERPLPALPPCVHYAGTPARMKKALELQSRLGGVFDLACDCEDGAPVGDEIGHATGVAEFIRAAPDEARIGVRIHPASSRVWREELRLLLQLAGERLAFITLPKARGVADVALALNTLQAERARLGVRRDIPLHVLIETHGALHEVFAIAALPGVESLDFGLMDFVSAHQGAIGAAAMKSPGQFEHPLLARAKTELVAAALAYGVLPVHNVSLILDDPEAVYADALRARAEFGFLRMWSIHPAQIQPILRAFTPANEELERATSILLAAQAAQWGPIRHQGELHDRASYRYYWQTLARAAAAGAVLQQTSFKKLVARD